MLSKKKKLIYLEYIMRIQTAYSKLAITSTKKLQIAHALMHWKLATLTWIFPMVYLVRSLILSK